jgi:hypothetical protein
MQTTNTFPDLSNNVNLKGGRRGGKSAGLKKPMAAVPIPMLPPKSRTPALPTPKLGAQSADPAPPKSPMQGSSRWQPRKPMPAGSHTRSRLARSRQKPGY